VFTDSRIGKYLNPRLARPGNWLQTVPGGPIPLGSSFTIQVQAQNAGTFASPNGYIHLAFPDLTLAEDQSRVTVTAKDTDLTCSSYPAGYSGLVRRRGDRDLSAAYLHVECVDTSWQPGETNFVTVSITPKAAGDFRFWYRTAMVSENEYFYNSLMSDGDAVDAPPSRWSGRSVRAERMR